MTDLRRDDLGIVAGGARQVLDRDRDAYFRHVADRLRGIRFPSTTDVKDAVSAAVIRYRGRT